MLSSSLLDVAIYQRQVANSTQDSSCANDTMPIPVVLCKFCFQDYIFRIITDNHSGEAKLVRIQENVLCNSVGILLVYVPVQTRSSMRSPAAALTYV